MIMDYEKKYKEALGWMQSVYPTMTGAYKEDAEHFFPELKESENERIRKWIIDDIRYNMNNEPLNNSEYKKKAEKAIAWLEKYGNIEDSKDFHPATKEQRDLLFQKMKEAGYECNAEKKELKRLENQTLKSKWTDDDEQYLLVCKNALHKYQVSDKWDADIISKWLEDKLKQGQQKSKWSEEDDYNVQCCIAKAESDITNGYPGRNKELIEWLKQLKQRMEE